MYKSQFHKIDPYDSFVVQGHIYIYIYIYVYTGASQKIRMSWKS